MRDVHHSYFNDFENIQIAKEHLQYHTGEFVHTENVNVNVNVAPFIYVIYVNIPSNIWNHGCAAIVFEPFSCPILPLWMHVQCFFPEQHLHQLSLMLIF